MPTLELAILVCLGSLLAGLLGSLTGLGGGAVIVPMLVLGFGVDIRYAMGASLISVIATSSGAAAAYVREGFSNIRIGMFLEIATAAGAVVGASLVHAFPTSIIAMVFGSVLIFSAGMSLRPQVDASASDQPDRIARLMKMDSTYPTLQGGRSYCVRRIPAGFAAMFGAGILSGLLGIGSGAFKVLAMDNIMRLPFKVSATTSNFMIGVTAAAGAGVYLREGYVAPGLAMPVILGTLLGSVAGTRVLLKMNVRGLRMVFGLVVLALGIEMIYGGLTGEALMPAAAWTDEKVDRLIGVILQTGVVLAGILVLTGGTLYLVKYGMMPENYGRFGAEPSEIHGILPILARAARWDGRSIIELGILTLVATPVVRVLFSVVAFGVQRDKMYVSITLVVLGILVYGLFGGR